MSAPFIVTIDGPAGVGKSTLAKRVAAALGVAYLDTGAMFRTVALAVFSPDGPPLAEEALRNAQEARSRFQEESAQQRSEQQRPDLARRALAGAQPGRQRTWQPNSRSGHQRRHYSSLSPN